MSVLNQIEILFITAGCADGYDACVGWANRGECRNNPDWMLKNCRLSCGVCKKIPKVKVEGTKGN